MQKKVLVTLLALCMLLGALPLVVSAGETVMEHEHVWDESGDCKVIGCDAAVISISDKAALLALMASTDADALKRSYILTENIALADTDVQSPIGDASTPFAGTFYGNGKTISGINLSGSTYVALFGTVTGTVQDLTVSGSITGTGNYLGGIAGFAGSEAVITNCVNACTVTGGTSSANVGGISGRAEDDAVISYCHNNAAVKGKSNVGGIVGGIVGDVTVSACRNSGAVESLATSGNAGVGGIGGYVAGSAVFENCWNEGNIISSRQYVGGIIGQSNTSDAKISGCYSNGTFTVADSLASNVYVRSITGRPFAATYTDCYFSYPSTAGSDYTLVGDAYVNTAETGYDPIRLGYTARNAETNAWENYTADKEKEHIAVLTAGGWEETSSGLALKAPHTHTWTNNGDGAHKCSCGETAAHAYVWGDTASSCATCDATCGTGGHTFVKMDKTNHKCSVCDPNGVHAAAHNFHDSECVCGLVKLQLTALDMRNGKFVPTFSSDVAFTVAVSDAVLSDDGTKVIASGFTLQGTGTDDYVFEAPDSLEITLDADDYVTVTVKYVCDGTEIKAAAFETFVKTFAYTLSAPDIDGYTFVSWSVDNPYTAPNSNAEVTATYRQIAVGPVEEDTASSNNNAVVAIAIAARNNRKCVVTYKSTGAKDHVSETVKKGTVLAMPETPTKEGYTFIGWYKDINGTKPFDFNAKITGSVSIYAKWVKN